MRYPSQAGQERRERGATLVILGLALVALIGVLSLAIDLGMLYVGRNEAQRAADAAALAGAYKFSVSPCTAPGGDCSSDTNAQAAARSQAEAVGDTNFVLSQQVNIADADVVETFPKPIEPQVTVTVRRSNVPTIFAKILGQGVANVSAVATAEAYESGTIGCVVPFLLADCQPYDASLGSYNACPTLPGTATPSYFFINPGNGDIDRALIGQSILLHTTTVNSSPVASQWYLASLGGTGTPSRSVLRTNIENCSVNAVTCGDNQVPIPTIPGTSVGPVDQGVDALIGASGDGPLNGQDVLVSSNPLIIASGGPSGPLSGGPSRSMASIPVYDNVNAASPPSTALVPGFQNQVHIVGYIQVFINYVAKPGLTSSLPAPCDTSPGPFNNSPVCVTILSIGNCPAAPVTSTFSTVPVRLIQGPG
ncbi:MAG TPA: pilus assembly protein TadG-related protein [Candidatus Acidoferrales bacterium]|nr:pilus assembly protein TadG-related protein [Candidatus Acidoferrales bacterium]